MRASFASSCLRRRPASHRWLATAVILLCVGVTTGCATRRNAVPAPFPSPSGAAGEPEPDSDTESVPLREGFGADVADTALALRGVPYRNGGTHPDHGFDCSGLVQYVYARHGVQLPRSVSSQQDFGEDVRDLRPGDLLFFSTMGGKTSHVGISLGGDDFVHAPNSRSVVRIDSLRAPYWGIVSLRCGA